jgi:glyoxalase-like protein
VLVAGELEPLVTRMRDALGLGEPYADPGVAVFGLKNAVMSLGSEFLEVVAPTQPGTAAGRHLDRRGEGGYMLIVQVGDLPAARARAKDLDIRTAWEIDLPDIAATHLHPSDVGGTILSIDQPLPPESWRWGGPGWTGQAGNGPPGQLRGAKLQVPDPEATGDRWARLLDLPAGNPLTLDGGQQIAFEAGDGGLTEVTVEVPDAVRGGRDALEHGSARVLIKRSSTP